VPTFLQIYQVQTIYCILLHQILDFHFSLDVPFGNRSARIAPHLAHFRVLQVYYIKIIKILAGPLEVETAVGIILICSS
jgi:hypothetical protein